MDNRLFEVEFTDGVILSEWAFDAETAKLYAQSYRRNRGENTTVKMCNFIEETNWRRP